MTSPEAHDLRRPLIQELYLLGRRQRNTIMTIAGGFPSQGGVLMCSDTLITGGDINTAQKKIWGFNFPRLKVNMAIAFAGTVPHCASVINRVYQSFAAIDPATDGPLTNPLVVSRLEDILLLYHRRHIYPHPLYDKPYGPVVQLVVAVQYSEHGQVYLFETDEANVAQCASYAFVGTGESVARYIIEPLAYLPVSGMPRKQVLLLADHMLYQVKRFVPGCGGASQFLWLGEDATFHPLTTEIFLPEAYSRTFRRIIADLFYAGADLDRGDALVSLGLELTDKRIADIRSEQRSERRRRKQLGHRIGLSELPVIGMPTPLTQRKTVPKRQVSGGRKPRRQPG